MLRQIALPVADSQLTFASPHFNSDQIYLIENSQPFKRCCLNICFGYIIIGSKVIGLFLILIYVPNHYS